MHALGLNIAVIVYTHKETVLGGMLQHDLRELLPLMEASGFSDVEFGPAKFRILGLSILAFVRGSTRKS